MSNQKFDIEKLTLPLMGLILVIGAAIFFFTKGDAGITGKEALSLQNTSFWVWTGIFALIAIFAAIKLYQINKNESTKPGMKTILLAVIVICLTAPLGKGCTSKVDPVSAPKYQPTSPAP